MSRLIDADKLNKELLRFFPSKPPYDYTEKDNLVGELLCDVGDVIDEQPTAGWISVKDELPNENKTYLVFAPSYGGCSSKGKESHDEIMFSRFQNGKWGIETGYYKRKDCVLYWMPLPKPPEE